MPFIVKPKIVCMHRDEVVNSVISQQAHLRNFQRYHKGFQTSVITVGHIFTYGKVIFLIFFQRVLMEGLWHIIFYVNICNFDHLIYTIAFYFCPRCAGSPHAIEAADS